MSTPGPIPAGAAWHDAAASGLPALDLRGLRKRFGRTEVLRGVDLAITAGERVALIGPNGSGKSTLFDLVSGRQAPSSGQIRLHGARIDGLPPYRIHRMGLSRSFQTSHLFPQLSVFENLRCGMLWSLGHRYSLMKFLGGLHDVQARTEQLLQALGLAACRDVPSMNLSYARQRALEIGVTVAGGAEVLLLDEPTAGMSRTETRHFIDLIRRLTVGKTLLMVEHDMGVVFDLADRVAVLVRGEVIAFGTPGEVRSNPQVQQAYLGTPAAPAEKHPCSDLID